MQQRFWCCSSLGFGVQSRLWFLPRFFRNERTDDAYVDAYGGRTNPTVVRKRRRTRPPVSHVLSDKFGLRFRGGIGFFKLLWRLQNLLFIGRDGARPSRNQFKTRAFQMEGRPPCRPLEVLQASTIHNVQLTATPRFCYFKKKEKQRRFRLTKNRPAAILAL